MDRYFFLSPLLFVLTGCASIVSLFVPREVSEFSKKNEKLTKIFESENPDASHSYRIDDRQIHYVEVSTSKPRPLIIFVHGSPGEWKGWVEYLLDADLRARAHMIAVDRPGFGESGGGHVQKSLARQSQELSGLLDKVATGQRVVLVGHSFGGPLIARMAMDFPDKISDLVILAGSIDPALEKTKWYQYPADWWIVSWMLPPALRVTNREILPLKAELSAMLPLWPKITQNVSVVQGEVDDLVPAANADFARKQLVNAAALNVVLIPKMNHFLPWKQYSLVKEEILKHL